MENEKKEFIEKLREQILNLGFDKSLLENPQFADFLSSFFLELSGESRNLITKPFKNSFMEEGIQITQLLGDQKNEKGWKIQRLNETGISFERYEKITYLKDQTSREEHVTIRDTEKIAKLSKEGELIIDMYHAEATNSACPNPKKEMSIYRFHQRDWYDNSGVMFKQESESFDPFILEEDINRPLNMLDTMKVSNIRFEDASQISPRRKTRLIREGLDVAWAVEEIREWGKSYKTIFRGTVPLNTEHGVREMRIYGENFPEVKILPMPQEKIDELIEMEKNPKVKDRLREIARGRENFYYNSENDENFIYVSESTNSRGR